MDIKSYINPLIRWWWLLVVATLISLASAFIVTRNQPVLYQASTTLVLGRAVYQPNPNAVDLYLGQQLASYYADLANREVVRRGTMDALGIEWLPNYVAQPLPNSQFLEISVTDVIPDRAMIVANELANQLIKQTPADQEAGNEFVNEQLLKLEASISSTEEEINQKEAELRDLNSAREISAKEVEISALQDKLSRMQSTYATLVANSNRGAINTLSVIEPATLPHTPLRSDRMMIILLSAVVGLSLAAGAAYLLEYIDDTFKTADDVSKALNLPVIGLIPKIDKKEDESDYVGKYPRSPVAEAFRSLRTNIEFLSVDEPLKSILISSPDTGEGKSFVAINLAISLSQSGKKTILVDADLRSPSIHQLLNVDNNLGLSDMFRTRDAKGVIKNLDTENLMVITSGSLPPNPAELLGSKRMKEILDLLSNMADVVVVDGPPFIVTDAAILSAQTRGVIMVVRNGYTSRKRAQIAQAQLQRARANILGVTFNQLALTKVDYYYYYSSDDEREKSLMEKFTARQLTLDDLKNWVGQRRDHMRNSNGKSDKGKQPVSGHDADIVAK